MLDLIRSLWPGRGSLTQAQARLYRMLSMLLRAGYPIAEALQHIARQEGKKGPLREALHDLAAHVSSGDSLEAALGKHPRLFPLKHQRLLGAAEAAGRIDPALDRLSGQIEYQAKAARSLLARLLYPFFLAHFAVLALGLEELVTRGVGPFLAFAAPPLAILYGSVVLAAIAWRHWLRRPSIELRVVRVPVLGRLIRSTAALDFLSSLEGLYEAGVGIADAFERSVDVVESPYFRARLARASSELGGGSSLEEALASSGLLPAGLLGSIAVAEASGSLGEVFSRSVATLEEESREALSRLVRAASIAAYALIVTWVAFAILRWWTRYLDVLGSFL